MDKGEVKEGLEDWNATIWSIPRTEPFKYKKIVITSPKGKEWTFDTEDKARRMFPDYWDKIKSGQTGYKVTGLDEGSVAPVSDQNPWPTDGEA